MPEDAMPVTLDEVTAEIDRRFPGDAGLTYVDTIPKEQACMPGVVSHELRDLAEGLQDVDEHHRIVVRLIDDEDNTVRDMMFVNGADVHDMDQQAYTASNMDRPPKNYADMLQRPDKGRWVEAHCGELRNLSGAWEWCNRPRDVRPVKIITLYTIKQLACGALDRYKCRMVANCSQVTKADVGETYQHVAEAASLRCMCAYAAQHGYMMRQSDVDRAFLQGDGASTLYAIPPDGVTAERGRDGRSRIWKVTGNLYGKLDAPRVFGRAYDSRLRKFPSDDGRGNVTTVRQGNVDSSMWHFERRYPDGEVRRCHVLVYVDDNNAMFLPDERGWELYRDIMDHVNARFKIKPNSEGLPYGQETYSFLGCSIEHDWEAHTVSLSLPGKIQDLLEKTGMSECHGMATTATDTKPLTWDDSPAPAGCGEACPKSFDYQGVTGSLLWISRMARPDLSQRAGELARFNQSPGVKHMHEAKHLLRYLRATQDDKLVYRRVGDPTDPFCVLGYVDADYSPDYGHAYRNHKSTTGYMFTQHDVAVDWRSRKQTVMGDSTGAVELIAAADASKQAVWLRRWYQDIESRQDDATPLYEDNKSCIGLVKNYCGHDRVKHMDVRVSLVREHYHKSLVSLAPVPTVDQLADGFTKPMVGPRTARIRAWMLRGEVPSDCTITPSAAFGAAPRL